MKWQLGEVVLFLLLSCTSLCHSLQISEVGNDPVKKAICFGDLSPLSSNCVPSTVCNNVKQFPGWTVCLDNLIAVGFQNCLVYSIGIAHEWAFDEGMGALGCEVAIFIIIDLPVQ